jgi:hypothetical protein
MKFRSWLVCILVASVSLPLASLAVELGTKLAPATATQLGGVKVGTGLSVSPDGTLSNTGMDSTARSAAAAAQSTANAALPTAGGTMSGNLGIKTRTTGVVVVAASGSALNLDMAAANIFDVTLTANCTFTISNPPASGSYGFLGLILRQDATGGRSITFPSSVDFGAAGTPSISTGASQVSRLTLDTVNGGTSFYGSAPSAGFTH